jgi:hypothetical protein
MMLKQTFEVGPDYTCTASLDTDTVPRVGVARIGFEWDPDVPDWSNFTPKEHAAYAAGRNKFLAKVGSVLGSK